ncbi:hypothetical protein [Demequina litorisediminis]|uniref:hypothetical protein n=1 Tax=Demequina litorisediminis TaxID=1849022 RepID=UPI0024E04D26|nr:hypothetical protein [Demequina litorisediminis]
MDQRAAGHPGARVRIAVPRLPKPEASTAKVDVAGMVTLAIASAALVLATSWEATPTPGARGRSWGCSG